MMLETPGDLVERAAGDIALLGYKLEHRGGCTENERLAAAYIRERLATATPDVSVEEFAAVSSPLYVIASSCGDFVFVALISIWAPLLAAGYGLFAFFIYLAEITGYGTVSRLMRRHASQNVIARFYAPQPLGLIVVTANYDTPRATPLAVPPLRDHLRSIHLLIFLCMLLILCSAISQAIGVIPGGMEKGLDIARWTAASILLASAMTLIYWEASGDWPYAPDGNTTGAAALLTLADLLREHPPEHCDVCLAATGNDTGWLCGSHALHAGADFDKSHTWFLGVQEMDEPGPLAYVRAEGLLRQFTAPPEMITLATDAAAKVGLDATPMTNSGWPSSLLIPLTRGFKAVAISRDPYRAESDEADSEVAVLTARWLHAMICRIEENEIRNQPAGAKDGHDL